jgi:starvation-inducible DNA-binding protein
MADGINTGPEAQGRTEVAQGLSKRLADTYAVYLKTHGYHWNLRGPNFAALHQLFMEHDTEMWNAIEDVAERIRAPGEFASNGYSDRLTAHEKHAWMLRASLGGK